MLVLPNIPDKESVELFYDIHGMLASYFYVAAWSWESICGRCSSCSMRRRQEWSTDQKQTLPSLSLTSFSILLISPERHWWFEFFGHLPSTSRGSREAGGDPLWCWKCQISVKLNHKYWWLQLKILNIAVSPSLTVQNCWFTCWDLGVRHVPWYHSAFHR